MLTQGPKCKLNQTLGAQSDPFPKVNIIICILTFILIISMSAFVIF